MTLLAAAPILFLLLLMLALRTPLALAAPLSWVLAAVIAMIAWSLPVPAVFSSLLKGSLITVDVLLIIFGAIFFLEFLRRFGYLRLIENQLSALSPDRRIQAVVIAWLFGSFIEGTAGFGTPAAIVAPLLLGIGFPPLTAVLVALAAVNASVAFGAVGTPIRVGFVGLDTANVPLNAALINLVAGLSAPLIIVAFVVRTRGAERWRSFIEILPWGLWSGLAFLVPYVLFSFLGQEFPSLLGAPIGMILTALSLHYRFLVPKRVWRFDNDHPMVEKERSGGKMKAAVPYLVLIGLLIVGKFIFGPLQYKLHLPQGLTHSVHLFNPGFAFLLTSVVLARVAQASIRDLREVAFEAALPLKEAAISILFVTSLVQVMVATDMLTVLAASFRSANLPFFSTLLGTMGAFLAGSATVSNLLFGPIQAEMAASLGLPVAWILASQLVGAGAGNMVALANILAVQATVGMKDREALILVRLAFPCLVYVAVATAAALVFM